MTGPFVHLRLHTEYSLVDSVVRIPALVKTAAALHMPAVAVTDQGNLFGMVKFLQATQRGGVKPIVGVDLWLRQPDDPSNPCRLTLLCQNRAGYGNLARLVTRSYLEGQHRGVPMIEAGWFDDGVAGGLIALSGGHDGDIGRALLAGREHDARERLSRWLDLFSDRFYLEVSRTGRVGEDPYSSEAVTLAARTSVPLVATNDVRFLRKEDFDAHEVRVCINRGYVLSDQNRPREYTPQQFLRSTEEMQELFSDLPEALENTVEIARRCNLEVRLGESSLPEFPVPDGMSADGLLRREAQAGFTGKFDGLDSGAEQRYRDRLGRELDVICSMGFAGYFLIVADFVRWARENSVPVGPGRGSGAGSLVAFVLGIADIDPLQHDLLFERFLNPERVSMPDFDIDFCMEGRDRVIEYVSRRYGRDRVSQIITFGTMAARAVVRDVGRVLGHPYGFVDRIAKLIPFVPGMTLEQALTDEPDLRELCDREEEVRSLIELARPLEGLARNAGKHAGGVVIAPSSLTEYMPLYCEDDVHQTVTQFDKDDVEAVGLVKFDFLGLRTLTIIDRAVATINEERAARGESALEISAVPMDDPEPFRLLNRLSTTAIFQLESRGMRDLIRRLAPDRFEDVVALVALFRPGPLQSGMVDDFISRKHDTATAIDYLHPDLQPVLEATYGVILYQEQVMQIAQVLAGYTLGEADLLRRAMGKKKPEEMAKQRSVFTRGAAERAVPEAKAARIFDLMEKFAGYGFNKSHSVAYAVLSYQTAWLKARYPAAFMAAVMSSEMDHTEKIVTLLNDCKALGISVQPPDLNGSSLLFSVASHDSIRYGLGAIRGVGRAAVDAIVEEREAGGAFADLDDLCTRVDLQRVNRRVLEALIKAGALDCFKSTRSTLMAALPGAVQLAEQHSRACAAGQSDFFGLAEPVLPIKSRGETVELPEWPELERLAAEKESLGLYLTGHPMEAYRPELRRFTTAEIVELAPERGNDERRSQVWQAARAVTIAGLVVDLRKRGPRVTVSLDDGSGRIEVTVFDDVYQRHRDILVKDAILVVEGQLRYDEFLDQTRVTARQISDLDQARERHARHLIIRWGGGDSGKEFVSSLQEILRPYRSGPCDIHVLYQGPLASARVAFGDEWSVRPTRELLDQLRQLVGSEQVQVVYQ